MTDLTGRKPILCLVNSSLVDEVAAVNDSIPPTATPHERWKKVNSWLRFKIAALTGRKRA